ncbi:MAG: T9SS type A sorting domain-containing protein, partial [Candidatus Neomarinimicrobiota bacterium]|nr:T9SS type A sorting domain-containing protein [Candidatus Neomarinimicrobiota bacterium]
VVKGEKLEDLDDPTTSTVIESMTLLANEMDGFVRVMAYSTSRANTVGDGMEGFLFHLTFKAVNGLASLPATISFGLGSLDLPGTSMDPEILNVACSFPDTSNMVAFSTTNLGVMAENGIPLKYNLSQNYPNPFNPSTKISFDLIEGGKSTLIVYNLLGKKINTLINVSLNAGHHSIEWNGLDYNGQSVASGVYFYELRSGDFIAKKKMLLLR